jgi:hypothetical protein
MLPSYILVTLLSVFIFTMSDQVVHVYVCVWVWSLSLFRISVHVYVSVSVSVHVLFFKRHGFGQRTQTRT